MILLAEYNTLRNEIISRTGHGFQLMSVTAAVVTIVNAIGVTSWKLLFFLVSVLILLTATYITFHSIKRLSVRVQELEAEINARAGETLLRWETRIGIIINRYGQLEIGRIIEEHYGKGEETENVNKVV